MLLSHVPTGINPCINTGDSSAVNTWIWYLKYSVKSSGPLHQIYRSTLLCQTCLSQIHGLCQSDHPFPNFSPILHCNSTMLMSNSVIMKTRLFRSDFSFPYVNFPFVYHCLYRSGQKVKRSE